MATGQDPWFLSERSEAMAGLLLTSREDVRVLHESKGESAIDLLVGVNGGGPPASRLFLVEVKGTLSSEQREWMLGLPTLFAHNENAISLPTCLFIINVKTNESWYAWVAKPEVAATGPMLCLARKPEFGSLDRSALDEIIERVKAWYNAFPRRYSGEAP